MAQVYNDFDEVGKITAVTPLSSSDFTILKGFFKLVMQYPDSATRDVRESREQMLDILEDYFSDMQTVEQTADDIIWRWHQIMLQRSGSMTHREIVAAGFSIFWG
jgi:hypothetical protein